MTKTMNAIENKIKTMTQGQLEAALNNYQIIMAPVWANQSRNAKVTMKGYMSLHESLRRVDR